MNPSGWPSVTVIIPTFERPLLVRESIDAVTGQDYQGRIDVFVVHDGEPVDASLERSSALRSVSVMENQRVSGLAGARNTGILRAEHALVAFCDDDDTWLPEKLSAQVAEVLQDPAVEMVSCGIFVDYDGQTSIRLAGTRSVTFDQLIRSRMSMLHSSTFLIRRAALVDGLGLVDERIPGAQNEDWDLVLRASQRNPVTVVDRPLVRVRWGRTSFYARRWDTKVESLLWMLDRHPELKRDKVGSSRVYGQIAFAHACAGRRREALRWAARTLTTNPLEWRAAAALLVASRLVRGEWVLSLLHRFGRGV